MRHESLSPRATARSVHFGVTVRARLALTVFATGLATALLVIATVLYAFQRFEREITYHRSSEFLARVVAMYDNLLELHERQPEEFRAWLRGLVLFEPDTQLYLLDARGTVLASSGETKLAPGFRVALAPVREAVDMRHTPYVMGDDPERMDADAVIAAQPLRRAVIRAAPEAAGYLYLVAHTRTLPAGGWATLQASFARPALGLIGAVVALTTLLAVWIVAAVTRPLRRLTESVAAISRAGLDAGALPPLLAPLPPSAAAPPAKDEFGQLADAFRALLLRLREQWAALRRLDHFRREAVSNLSHDLRSPLTATSACLETLDARWAGDAARFSDRQLLEVALRNTRNASRLVQSLGDLARLDEPEFRLTTEVVDVRELLDDIQLRFAERAAQAGIELRTALGPTPAVAAIDIELFERAVANLLDNALKFARPGDRITLGVEAGARVVVRVADSGPGIAEADLPQLFDRFYQSRHGVAPATGEGGKGLGLAIVKRIAELHGGEATVASAAGRGTTVSLSLPSAVREPGRGAPAGAGKPQCG
jgi:signal transduction histidine kinase